MLCVFIDGTHLSNDGGQKCLPVYLTSGNLDSSVCRYLPDTCQTSVYSYVFCRDRDARVLLGFLPLLGKGYTSDEMKTPWFKDRQTSVLQQALRIVRKTQMSSRTLPGTCDISVLQMFAPLLEPGRVRDGTVLLRDPAGVFRRFALRVGMLMADIPEICRQLGKLEIRRRTSTRGLPDVYESSLAGVHNSISAAFPCYKCLAPRDSLSDFNTRFPLRHAGLAQAQAAELRQILLEQGSSAMKEARKA